MKIMIKKGLKHFTNDVSYFHSVLHCFCGVKYCSSYTIMLTLAGSIASPPNLIKKTLNGWLMHLLFDFMAWKELRVCCYNAICRISNILIIFWITAVFFLSKELMKSFYKKRLIRTKLFAVFQQKLIILFK